MPVVSAGIARYHAVMGSTRRDVTQADYDELLAALRAANGSVTIAARALGIPRVRLNKVWMMGYPSIGAPPLRDKLREELALLAQEQAEATPNEAEPQPAAPAEPRSSLNPAQVKFRTPEVTEEIRTKAEETRTRNEARDDAVTVLDEERRLRKGGRAVAGQNLVASARWGKAHQVVAEEIVRRVENERSEMSISDLADLARTMAMVDRQRMALLREAAELERLHRGDPSVIVGVTPAEMSTEEAIKEIERANLTLTRYKRRGLALISGGEQGQEQESEGPVVTVTPAG